MQAGRLRFGVIGTSRIADTLIRAIRASNNCELRAVASRDLERAQVWARERAVPVAFGSYEEMLASDEIDAAYIPLPNSLHKEWSVRAAQNGKHVLCEKPIAAGPDEVREMIAAAETHRVKLMEGFMYRFHPKIERVRKLLAEGAIGEIKIVRATFGFYLDRPDDIRLVKELAGGSLMDVGCYCVNIARLVAGAEPGAVSASATWGPTGVDESLVGILEFPEGVLGAIDGSFRTGVTMQQKLDISGTRGRIELSEPFRAAGEGPAAIVISSTGRTETVHAPGGNGYLRMVEHFANAVLSNGPLDYTPQDSLGNMLAIAALYESARSGRRVEVGRKT